MSWLYLSETEKEGEKEKTEEDKEDEKAEEKERIKERKIRPRFSALIITSSKGAYLSYGCQPSEIGTEDAD